jgi:hypothetical protein
MAKKLLLSVINGMLWVGCYSVVEASEAAFHFPAGGDLPFGKGETVKKEPAKGKKFRRNRSVEPKQPPRLSEDEDLLPPPPPQEETREVVQVVYNAAVRRVNESHDYDSPLWQAMLDLTGGIIVKNRWGDSRGVRRLVYRLAKMYKTANQNTKDAIALYLVGTADSYAGELAGGDDDDAEQNAIDFARQCMVDENGQLLFPEEE